MNHMNGAQLHRNGKGTAQVLADLFHQFDADGDGRISRNDAAATGVPEEEFDAADHDGDGYWSVHELSAWLRSDR
jgi:Ca2+-binding EF-hand superfamily protein